MKHVWDDTTDVSLGLNEECTHIVPILKHFVPVGTV
jgi:hypothetical protein